MSWVARHLRGVGLCPAWGLIGADAPSAESTAAERHRCVFLSRPRSSGVKIIYVTEKQKASGRLSAGGRLRHVPCAENDHPPRPQITYLLRVTFV